MKQEKHEEALREVLDEIESASKAPEGLIKHQRRLAFALSLGASTLIELYLHKSYLIKEGSRIDYRWFKKNNKKIKEQLEKQITSPADSIENIDNIIEIARKIEEGRDDIAYGSPVDEKTLQEKINLFFKLKELVKC